MKLRCLRSASDVLSKGPDGGLGLELWTNNLKSYFACAIVASLGHIFHAKWLGDSWGICETWSLRIDRPFYLKAPCRQQQSYVSLHMFRLRKRHFQSLLQMSCMAVCLERLLTRIAGNTLFWWSLLTLIHVATTCQQTSVCFISANSSQVKNKYTSIMYFAQ